MMDGMEWLPEETQQDQRSRERHVCSPPETVVTSFGRGTRPIQQDTWGKEKKKQVSCG